MRQKRRKRRNNVKGFIGLTILTGAGSVAVGSVESAAGVTPSRALPAFAKTLPVVGTVTGLGMIGKAVSKIKKKKRKR